MTLNNRVCVKYKDELLHVLTNTNGEKVFTYHDIELDNNILKTLQNSGFIARVGRKRINHQWVNTYMVTLTQRFKIKKMLENL